MNEKEKLSDEREHIEGSLANCISVLESLRDRTKTYEHMYPHYPKDYLDRLAEVDRAALDKAILVLKYHITNKR